VTPRSSSEPEIAEEYTDVSNQEPNQNPSGAPTAHDWHGSGAQTAYKPTGFTLLGNPNQTLTQDASLIEELVPAIGANTTLRAGVSPGPSLSSQMPPTNPL